MLERIEEPLNIFQLRRAGGAALSSYDIHYAPVIDSTMNLLPWCVRHGIDPKPGFCLIAGLQTNGVGQHGAWQSTDRDIKLSVVLPEVTSAREHAIVSCAAGLAVQRTLTELARDYTVALTGVPSFYLKLMNDVLCRENGAFRKISGSLAIGDFDPDMKRLSESRDGFVFPEGRIVLGIGVNLKQLPRPVIDPRFEPIAFEEITGSLVSREVAIGILLRNLSGMVMLARSQPGMLLGAALSEVAKADDGQVLIVSKCGREVRASIEHLTPEGIFFRSAAGVESLPLEQVQRVVPAHIA